LLYQ